VSFTDRKTVMVVEVLLHTVDKSAISAYGFVTFGAFQMKMAIVSPAVTVYRAFSLAV